ncbi:MAG: 16S rRNA (cytidine(1402)-2'-O)-methyltransferase [Deltaproteobacteria bacterium]|nr:16S rRNA (cytidine(1402)-2'-O)-methyltransferase [Deltaproteobacteria bacterium]
MARQPAVKICETMEKERTTTTQAGILEKKPGSLYIVSTPIGNLEDITLRALRTLQESDLIAAETIGHTKGLCRHYGITTSVTSYNQHNRLRKGPELLRKLKSGCNIALVCNAGTPAVSDPGSFMIKEAVLEGIKVIPVPGPSALITALSISGLRSDEFLFLGFLSNRPGKRKKQLKELTSESRTMIFYETSRRLLPFIKDVEAILGNRDVEIFRELTKIYEEAIRGNISQVLKKLAGKEIKGEITLLVSGNENPVDIQTMDEKMKKKVRTLLLGGHKSSREIAEQLSYENGIPYRAVYRECIAIKKTMGTLNRVVPEPAAPN